MPKTYFVVTGIVMNDENEGKVLILKKSPSDRNYPNHWSFCSGFVKEFEAAEDTVLREIKEETNLDAEIVKEGKLFKKHDKTTGKNWIIQPFLCKAKQTNITLDHENTEYKWVDKEELENFRFVPGLIEDLRSIGMIS